VARTATAVVVLCLPAIGGGFLALSGALVHRVWGGDAHRELYVILCAFIAVTISPVLTLVASVLTWRLVRRNGVREIQCVVAVLAVGLAVAISSVFWYGYLTRPLYQATSHILIERNR